MSAGERARAADLHASDHPRLADSESVLDEHLSTVCFLRDGKIAAIETFLSDVAAMNAFFV